MGSCCKGASPSKPYHQLLARAAAGDDFARGFFSIMVPYKTHAEAEAVVPGVVERTLKAATKLSDFQNPERDLVFYQCRYQTEDNRCGVWEDRPQFCRDYPDTPFVVMAPGCAFEPWAMACKDKYQKLKDEVNQLKGLKEELSRLKSQQSSLSEITDNSTSSDEEKPYTALAAIFNELGATEAGLSVALSMTRLFVSTPLRSTYFLFFEQKR